MCVWGGRKLALHNTHVPISTDDILRNRSQICAEAAHTPKQSHATTCCPATRNLLRFSVVPSADSPSPDLLRCTMRHFGNRFSEHNDSVCSVTPDVMLIGWIGQHIDPGLWHQVHFNLTNLLKIYFVLLDLSSILLFNYISIIREKR